MNSLLLNAIDQACVTWEKNSHERRTVALAAIINESAVVELSTRTFDRLPDVIQLLLALHPLNKDDLNTLATSEGYLDIESRGFLQRKLVIYIIAGSMNRGSAATETSVYRRSASSRWIKLKP